MCNNAHANIAMKKTVKKSHRRMGKDNHNRLKIMLALILLVSATIAVFVFKKKLAVNLVDYYQEIGPKNNGKNTDKYNRSGEVNNYTESDRKYLENILKEKPHNK
jgi:hypothetical protein